MLRLLPYNTGRIIILSQKIKVFFFACFLVGKEQYYLRLKKDENVRTKLGGM